MATLAGALQLRGTIDNLSYYPHPNGKTIVRRKGGPSPQRVRTHHHFERTRENIRDFGSAASVAGKLRKAMMPHMEYMSDGTYFNRLVGLVSLVAKTDRGHSRGEKHAYDGNIHLLEDFQWNAKLAFDEALQAECSYNLDPATGAMSLDISSFVPLASVKAPGNATHFQIVLRGSSIYQGKDRGPIAMTAAPLMALNSRKTGDISLSLDNRARTDQGQGLFLMGAGIIFYEEVDGIPFAIRGAGAFALLSVERVKPEEEEQIQEEALSPEDAKARKEARSSALELLIESMKTQHYGMVKGMTPLADNTGTKNNYQDQLTRMGRMLWLKKLEKYRRG